MKYRFLEERHIHQIFKDDKWQNLTGCTTILSVLAKPALIQWAADEAVSQLGWIKEDYYVDDIKVERTEEERLEVAKRGIDKIMTLDTKGYLELLDNARVAHCRKKEKAGIFGKNTHAEIEKLIKEAITLGGYVRNAKSEIPAVQNFIKWAADNKVKFLESEKHIYSEKHFLGGVVDFVCEIEERVWLGDIKTAKSGIYPENFAQMSGYQIMLNEMNLYPDILGYIVLNLKENGKMAEKRSISNENNINFFLSCLTIYREQERIKGQTL